MGSLGWFLLTAAALLGAPSLGPSPCAGHPAPPTPVAEPLVVHEWGTFTALQDESGRAIPGINSDDEPVPAFVHRLARDLVGSADAVPALAKGAPRAHPGVTLRLETPVVYFHLPPGDPGPRVVGVEVAFHGGWITEYFPAGELDVDGGDREGRFAFRELDGDSASSLTWRRLTVGAAGASPETYAHVWLAPRQVAAADVTAAGGEGERYLFYRGVGHLEPPLTAPRRDDGERLRLDAEGLVASEAIEVGWLVDVAADGTAAYRDLPAVRAGGWAEVAATFEPGEYFAVDLLRQEMEAALVADGLFADEAAAMLDTWELSYFLSPGTRIFFLVPRGWTDRVLPLRLSVPAEVVRVMVGRIELVSPHLRELLAALATGPEATSSWAAHRRPWALAEARAAGPALGEAVGLVHADLVAFEALGRFRHALVLDELARRPSERLHRFAAVYGLDFHGSPRPGG